MIPIRKRISRPYLLLIMLIPITILLFFNGIVYFYIRSQAEEDLQQAVVQITENLDALEDGELPDFPQNFQQAIGNKNGKMEHMANIATIIREQKHSASAELLVYTKNGTLSRVFNEQNFVNPELGSIIYQAIQELPVGDIDCIHYKNNAYYVIEVQYDGQLITDKMVYVSQGLVLDDFVATINMVLVLVSVLITGIALLVSTRVTNAIAKPIERLTALVENMKSDELLVIDDCSDNLELQHLTAEINALNRRIYQYNTSQKSFLHNASHELRTPLMSIQGYADGIAMGVFPDCQGTAQLISDQSKRLTKLVDGLLTLARVENFHANKKLESMDLSECLLDLVGDYNGYAMGRNIAIQTEITPHIWAVSNAELVTSAVGNLLSNAIRYAKTTVRIVLTVKKDRIWIAVQDDGAGIADTKTIFEKFSRGENGNFGLGLSITKSAVEMMHGQIHVRSENGALFAIELPV